MQQRLQKYFCILLQGALLVGGIWLSVRFFLPWAGPFILALIFASLLEPAVKNMSAHGFKRSVAAGILSLAALALICSMIFLLSSKCISAAADFLKKSPELMEAVGKGLEGIEEKAFSISDKVPSSVEQYLAAAAKSLFDAIYSLPGIISEKVLSLLGAAAQKSPSILLFTVTAGLGTYFISADYPETIKFLLLQLPEGLGQKLRSIKGELKSSLGGFMKAQLILMSMSFFQLLIFFLLMKIENALPLAALTALIDALPVFGTGIVLIPWAIYSFAVGDMSRAAGFLICWGSVNLVRSCAQAKLTGDEIGLNPLASLGAVYIGWRVWGVAGMLSFPLLFSLLQQLQEKGIIKIFKQNKKAPS